MKFSYKFSNLLGAVYHHGNILFTKDGTSVISPVGNRITIFDLKNNKSTTLAVESKYNYNAIDLSPNGSILLAVNDGGFAYIISMLSKMVIHTYRFKRKVNCVKFSPDGKYFAICKENRVFIYNSPGMKIGTYNPFEMIRVFSNATDDTMTIDWSFDSNFIAVGSKDKTTKVYSLNKYKNFRNSTLGCHSDEIIGGYFELKSYDILTLSKNGQLCIWECSIDPDKLIIYEPIQKKLKIKSDSDSEDEIDFDKQVEEVNDQDINNKFYYKQISRHYLCDPIKKIDSNAVLTASAYHKHIKILVVGFSNGSFFLYEMPDVNMIHSLNISNLSINSIVLNKSGDWIALGCSEVGQLLVWEWQSETYAMKQQSHSNNINSLSYSPDGQYIVTGGDDGKVKIWNTFNGFSTVTFSEHTSNITQVLFSNNRKFIVSSSLDGTVRAYDLTRYRNFKTFTSPRPVQFSCLALDASDEFLAAGGQDFFDIYLWSVKLGRLLEVMSGHEGPVSSLVFNPSPASTALASVSWDKTLKLWDAIENGSNHETIQLNSDGLCVVYNPNGLEVAVATLDGQISFFNIKTSIQIGSIEGKKDLQSGRSETDMITAKKNLEGKAFTCLSYSADGSCIIAGGMSKNVCIYSTKDFILIKKFEITKNHSFDAVDDFINPRKITDLCNKGLIEMREELEGGNIKLKLPGVRSGDMASRSFKPEIRVYGLKFSPTGHSWAAATTEGILIYSLDSALIFDPFELDLAITPQTIKNTLINREYSTALMMSLRLNEKDLIRYIIQSIPQDNIELIITNLPIIYVQRLLQFIAIEFEKTRHIHFYLIWIENILTNCGNKMSCALQMPAYLALQKNMQQKYDDLGKICDFNQYTIEFINEKAPCCT